MVIVGNAFMHSAVWGKNIQPKKWDIVGTDAHICPQNNIRAVRESNVINLRFFEKANTNCSLCYEVTVTYAFLV